MNIARKLTAIVLLGAIGLPAMLGVGLHWGQADCCSEISCCSDCPFSHDVDPVDEVSAVHECSICNFLAIAKTAQPVEFPEVALERLRFSLVVHFEAPFSEGASLAFLARGPPANLPV